MSLFDSFWVVSAGGAVPTVDLGDPFEGGYYAGTYANKSTGKTYAYILAPKAAELSSERVKTGASATAGTDDPYDGWFNSNNMNSSSHPAAYHCRGYRGGGHDDWFLGASGEMNHVISTLHPSKGLLPAGQELYWDILGAAGRYYWSSSSYPTRSGGAADGAWGVLAVSPAGVGINVQRKNTHRYVRPIRRIEVRL